ncbi:TPA: hypothetical protein ACH3X2_007060 [Trebouxia sp. C0005]
MSVPAGLLPKWGAKILRLNGFVSPLKTELKGYLKFCRTGRTMGCGMQRGLTGSDRQPLKALEALGTTVWTTKAYERMPRSPTHLGQQRRRDPKLPQGFLSRLHQVQSTSICHAVPEIVKILFTDGQIGQPAPHR